MKSTTQFFFNDERLPNIVIVSGWNVNSNQYQPLISLLKKTSNLLVVDLPGFGIIPLNSTTSFSSYVSFVEKAIKQQFSEVNLAIGYSFGGKILPYIKGNYPLFLIAPSLMKNRVKLKIRVKIIMYKICKKLILYHLLKSIPHALRGSNDYKNCSLQMKKVFLDCVNSYFSAAELKKISRKVYLLAYRNDNAVELKTMKKINKYILGSELIIRQGTHHSFFSDFNYLAFIIKELMA